MRKFTYIILAIFILLATSCSSELEKTMQNGKLSFSSINASMADLPTSRVHLEGSGKVVWDVNDYIGVYSDTQTDPVMFTCTSVGESNATFSSDDEVTGSNFFAYYPYENSKIVNGKIEYNLSSVTHYKEGSFYRQCPVIAKSNSNEFSFKQTCAILSFSISGSQTIESLTLKANNGEPLSGTGYIDIKADVPIFTIPTDNGINVGTTIEMLVSDKKLSKSEPSVFYFIVPVGKYSNGISLTISGKTETGESFNLCKTMPKCVETSRGVIKSFSVVETDELIEDYQSTVYSKLMAFYNATGGDNWINNTNWGSDKPFKEWYGITADDIFVKEISLTGNNLTGVISGELNDFSYLQNLNIGSNLLTSIKINSCSHLTSINCTNNKLTTLDVSNNLLLGILQCGSNELNSLNVSSCTGLFQIGAENNQLTTLDLSECFNMVYLSLNNNLLTTLDVSSCCKLYNLDCMANKLTSLKVVDKPNLLYLSCQGNELESLEVTDCESLQHLLFNFNQITSSALSITECPNLETLWCHQNKLETLDVTPFTKLKNLWCGNYQSFEGNTISTLDISKNTSLEEFSCYGMKLTSLDVSKNTNLLTLECSGNSIASLNVNNLSSLKELWCHTMNLSDNIDVSENTSLEYLCCSDNPDLAKIYIDSFDKVFRYQKDDATKFCIKGSDVLYDEFPYYTSTDYSKDGIVTLLQQVTIGKGIDIVLMGDAYSDRLIADGSYDKVMRTAMESFFSEEPYKSFRDYFNVYSVAVVSANEQYAGATSTAFSCYFGEDTHVGGNDEKVFTYAQKAIGEDQVEDAVIIVMMNAATYAGTCYMYYPQATNDYGKGASISYFPIGTDETMLEQVLHHEAGGHGFAKLGDEYAYEEMGAVTSDYVTQIKEQQNNWGWWKNVDFTNEPSTVRWQHFLADTRYSNEGLGVYEGGLTYWTGVWRPTENSIMYHNTGGFNAPSREAIYYRINKLAYGEDWEYDYEKFVEYDAINRTSTTSRVVNNFKQMPPLHAPVVVKGSWKDAKNNVPSRSASASSKSTSSSNLSSGIATPSMLSTRTHRVTLPDGRVMTATFDTSGKTVVEYENKK